MKKALTITVTIFLLFFSYFHLYSHSTIYDLYDNTKYDLVNNESYFIKANTKENYSGHLDYLDRDYINNKEEFYSMYYTVLNNGYDIYTFDCKYNCSKDVDKITKEELSTINELINPKNSFQSINVTYTDNNKVTLEINKKYSEDDLKRIDDEIDRLIRELKINSYTTIENKIRVFHDYIADHTKYDQERINSDDRTYHSETAIGPLFEGKGICDGYTDTLAFFLDKLGIDNIKVTNSEHVWNAVRLNGIWYHIDLTWDDPVYKNGGELTTHDYFLITTKALEDKNDNEHEFDKDIYDFIK